ncbi:D-alanine--D-alanine ligase family protein [Nguyenibacter vanlangensis]|uniref:D-alanine--D-alanine ligase n=1 Tax=Nguyenibacter vanlangensis TaxID=1216886 RepID=A0ABZ3D1R6_9PROT
MIPQNNTGNAIMANGKDSTKLRIALLFGGRSAEHDVSILSATNVIQALNPDRYDIIPIFITREGKWLLSVFENGALSKPEEAVQICLLPGGHGQMITIAASGLSLAPQKIDILFPILHGLHGEDGSVQGVAEVACVPLAGCGILGSAVALDKDIAKRLLREVGLRTARSITIYQSNPPCFSDVEGVLGMPVFIKPARQGSSVGVSKVATDSEFEAALVKGFEYDRKLLVEEFISGREIECSVLEDTSGGLFVSRPGEIMPAESHSFYSYDAKYLDQNGAVLKVPANLPPETERSIREAAGSAFKALGCDSMARVDFFLTEDMRFFVNEINTIPGFTDISMYPKAMAASGRSDAEIVDRLIEHGLARARRSLEGSAISV